MKTRFFTERSKALSRGLSAFLLAAAAAQADPPTLYRLALIQVAYKGKPAKYTVDQLKSAAHEITDYFSQISYGNFRLQIAVSSVTYLTPPCPGCIFPVSPLPYVFDKSGIANPDPSLQIVVQQVAELAHAADGIEFGTINGIAILNSFSSAGDYFTGSVIIPDSSPAHGKYETALLFENPLDPRLAFTGSAGIFWSPWAPLIGKMILSRAGAFVGPYWYGSPSGGVDGYSLLDACHPCAAGAYSVIGTSFMTGGQRAFNGWLPDSQVAVVARDFSSTTLRLTPLAGIAEMFDPTVCVLCSKVIKVPITPGYYYLVEARSRKDLGAPTPDALPNTYSRGGLWDEGIHITRVKENSNPPVETIHPCDSLPGGCVWSPSDSRNASCNYYNVIGFTVDTLPGYCWPYPLFHEGQSFTGEHGIQISFDRRIGDQFWVTVQRGPLYTVPDAGVVRRSSLPSDLGLHFTGLPLHQIWIDSSCNGYAADVGPAGLRFGDPANAQTLAIGDDLCLGHENRLYARIENRGTAPANFLRVHFDLGDVGADKGPCALENCPFTEVGVADAQRFPALASLAPGAQATVWVAYTPPGGQTLFATPALRIRIDPLQGEPSTDDNVAASIFGRVQALAGGPADIPLHAPDLIYTNRSAPATVFLNADSNLPRGVSVSTGQTPARIDLGQGQRLDVPISFSVAAVTGAAAGVYAANVTLASFVPVAIAPYPPAPNYGTIASQTVGLDIVKPSRIDLRATWNGNAQSTIEVHGQLQPGLKDTIVALDYRGSNNTLATMLVRTGGNGEFEAHLPAAAGSSVSALWSGDNQNAPAATGPVIPSNK